MIPTLTEHQHKLLRSLANDDIHVYGCPSGLDTDPQGAQITQEYHETIDLVTLGLATDVSSVQKFMEATEHWRVGGRKVAIIHLTVAGGKMFRRVPWEKWKN